MTKLSSRQRKTLRKMLSTTAVSVPVRTYDNDSFNATFSMLQQLKCVFFLDIVVS